MKANLTENNNTTEQDACSNSPGHIHSHPNLTLAPIMKNMALKPKMFGLNEVTVNKILNNLYFPRFCLSGDLMISIWKGLIKALQTSQIRPSGTITIFTVCCKKIDGKTVSREMTKYLNGIRTLNIISAEDQSRDWTNYTAELFVNVACRNFTHLQELNLYLFWDTTLTDKSLERIGTEIGTRLTYLKRLTLFTQETSTVTHKGVGLFLKAINKYIRNLVRLELHLENFEENVLEVIGDNLKRNFAASLVELKLSFSNYSIRNLKAIDKGLENLSLKIKKHLSSLKFLTLKVYGYRGVDDAPELRVLFGDLSQFTITYVSHITDGFFLFEF